MATANRSRRRSGNTNRRSNPPRRIAAPRVALPPAVLPYTNPSRSVAGSMLLWLPGLFVVLGALLAAIGLLVVGLVVIALGAGAFVTSALVWSPARLVKAIGARRADPVRDARLVNVVEGLCVAHGIVTPSLLVLEDRAANAITLGSSDRNAALIVTSGALVLLDRLELEGVVAHELAHLKRGDTRTTSLATRVLGSLSLLVSPRRRLLARVGDPTREFSADHLGAAMTRYPPGLRRALEKLGSIERRPSTLDARLLRLTAPFWFAPLDEDRELPVVAGVLDVQLRAAALAEL